MAPYIFGKRNMIHIIDIRETVKGLLRAKKFIARVVGQGEDVLFVGTKRQARPHVAGQAERLGMPWVTERWLGGMLTNYRTIRSRLARLEELEAEIADGTALEYSKKMRASRGRELRKIKRNLDGVRVMNRLPGVLVVVDVSREKNAVREARKLKIPTVCLIDTDSDPAFADVPIPGNDDAMRSIEVVLGHLGDAVEEGLRARQQQAEQAEDDQRDQRERGGRRGDRDRDRERPREPEPAAAIPVSADAQAEAQKAADRAEPMPGGASESASPGPDSAPEAS